MPNSFLSKKRAQAGFGLIELMVSISIAIMVMSVVMFNQGGNNSAVLLRSQAYEVALAIREVQLAAVSSNRQTSGYRSVLGMYFNTTNASTKGFYNYFLDNGNYFFDGSDNIIKRNNLDKRFEISEIRLIGSTVTTETDISITFERPNFDAIFHTGTGGIAAASAVEIDVRLKSTTGTGVGEVRTVEVTKTGQIIVQ